VTLEGDGGADIALVEPPGMAQQTVQRDIPDPYDP
jgi:hypothetical protein